MVYQGRSVLSAEFQLYRMLPGIGNNSEDLWPVIFGRGWCDYACWTTTDWIFAVQAAAEAMKEKLGILRYVMFALALSLVSGLFLMQVAHLSHECGGQQRITQAEERNGSASSAMNARRATPQGLCIEIKRDHIWKNYIKLG